MKNQSHEKSGGVEVARSAICPDHLNVSGLSIDVWDYPLGGRIGSKRPVAIDLKPGGNGANGGQVAVANNIACGVLGVQAAGDLASLSRSLLSRVGLQAFVLERRAARGAISIATPNGKPGAFDLDVQRMEPITVREFLECARGLATQPKSVFMGPMALGREPLEFHVEVARFARHRALMAHPLLLQDPDRLSEVGRLYEFVQMNYTEARLTDPSTDDIAKLACRVRYLLGEDIDFAITNSDREGLLWADRRWLLIRTPRIRTEDIRSDVGAGDVWGAAFCLSRWYFGATIEQAADYAGRAAAAWIRGQAIPAF